MPYLLLLKSSNISDCPLLQIIGGALFVKMNSSVKEQNEPRLNKTHFRVLFALQEIRSIHDSMNLPKIEFFLEN